MDQNTLHSAIFSHLRENLGNKLTPALVTGLTATLLSALTAAEQKSEAPAPGTASHTPAIGKPSDTGEGE